MREFLRSLGLLAVGVLKWLAVWGPLIILDSLDAYQRLALPALQSIFGEQIKMFPDPTPYLTGAAIILAIGWSYHKVREERDIYKPDPSLQGTWPIYYATQYLMDTSKWGCGKDSQTKLDGVLTEIREAAALGYVNVWGRLEQSNQYPGSNAPPEKIEKGYWRDHAFDEIRCLMAPDHTGGGVTRTDLSTASEEIYGDVCVVKKQIFSHWPKKALLNRIGFRSPIYRKENQCPEENTSA